MQGTKNQSPRLLQQPGRACTRAVEPLYPCYTYATASMFGLPGFPAVEAVKAPTTDSEKPKSAVSALGDSMKEVVTSWRTWLLALTYFFVYLIRQGCTSWLIFYLLEVKGAADTAAAAVTVSGGLIQKVWCNIDHGVAIGRGGIACYSSTCLGLITDCNTLQVAGAGLGSEPLLAALVLAWWSLRTMPSAAYHGSSLGGCAGYMRV